MRKKLYSGVYACPLCEDEFELRRASDTELECPDCGESLEPVLAENELSEEETNPEES